MAARSTLSLAAVIFAWVVPATAGATVVNIHVGGVCSTDFTDGKASPEGIGYWAGEVSVNAAVDQRDSMATATADLARVLDEHCVGESSCWIFTYSNGAAVTSRTLAMHDARWNIDWVANSAGNAGGSELSDLGWLGEVFGGCGLLSRISPSDHRAGWNHNDTQGASVVGIAGRSTAWWSLGITSLMLPGEDDTVVAFHSAGGMSSAGSYSNACDGPKYAGHAVWEGHCEGEGRDHMSMADGFICLLGGC